MMDEKEIRQIKVKLQAELDAKEERQWLDKLKESQEKNAKEDYEYQMWQESRKER